MFMLYALISLKTAVYYKEFYTKTGGGGGGEACLQ